MAHVVHDGTLHESWFSAVETLRANQQELFNLMVTIDRPDPSMLDMAVIRTLNNFLLKRGLQRVETVANTIFPTQLARSSPNRQALYSRYRLLLPRLRRLSTKNRRATYFARLIDFPVHQSTDTPTSVNQLETIIQDLERELRRRNPLRFIYEAQIFVPGKDRRPIGFPCMSSLSFQLDGSQLRLIATYRNQYFVERAMGNYLGLAQLQRFVAMAVNLDQGPLTVHAFHAQLDPDVSQRDVDGLLQACHSSAKGSLIPVAAA